jgi:hypothetical protein
LAVLLVIVHQVSFSPLNPADLLKELVDTATVLIPLVMALELFTTMLIAGNLPRPLRHLTDVLKHASQGQFDSRVQVSSNDEIRASQLLRSGIIKDSPWAQPSKPMKAAHSKENQAKLARS